ncbi:hypothetical protein, partial [Mitsuokella jalaludinii]|uniref:hypothetical protein n=1 Tax=Mitsuokella jalaludinii TaxID=187979 RepID=UPI0030793246
TIRRLCDFIVLQKAVNCCIYIVCSLKNLLNMEGEFSVQEVGRNIFTIFERGGEKLLISRG